MPLPPLVSPSGRKYFSDYTLEARDLIRAHAAQGDWDDYRAMLARVEDSRAANLSPASMVRFETHASMTWREYAEGKSAECF